MPAHTVYHKHIGAGICLLDPVQEYSQVYLGIGLPLHAALSMKPGPSAPYSAAVSDDVLAACLDSAFQRKDSRLASSAPFAVQMQEY